MADVELSELNHHENHALTNNAGDRVKIYGVPPALTENTYALVYDCIMDFLKSRNYDSSVFSHELFDRTFDLSLTNLWRAMNYHEFADHPSEPKLIARVLYYWLQHKPLRVKVSIQTRKDDIYYINERFVVKLVYAFIVSHLCSNATDGSECKHYHSIINAYRKRMKNYEYHLYKHSVTLNSMEEYIESLNGILCTICKAA